MLTFWFRVPNGEQKILLFFSFKFAANSITAPFVFFRQSPSGPREASGRLAAGTTGRMSAECLLYGITKAYRQHNRDTRLCNKVEPSAHSRTNVHLDVIINIIIIIIVTQKKKRETWQLKWLFVHSLLFPFLFFCFFFCRTQSGNLRASRSNGKNWQRHQPNLQNYAGTPWIGQHILVQRCVCVMNSQPQPQSVPGPPSFTQFNLQLFAFQAANCSMARARTKSTAPRPGFASRMIGPTAWLQGM